MIVIQIPDGSSDFAQDGTGFRLKLAAENLWLGLAAESSISSDETSGADDIADRSDEEVDNVFEFLYLPRKL